MLLRNRFSVAALALLATAVLSATAAAQRFQPFYEFEDYYNFQPFAPPIIDEYGPEPIPPNLGWYFTFDRMYMNVKRPEFATQPYQGDFTWGNRVEIGYMNEERIGWQLVGYHIDGPNQDNFDNAATIGGFQINRVWRMYPFHNQSFLEPFVGFRYDQFNDRGNGYVENHIVGGQIGGRLFKQTGHWLLSTEFKAFSSHNFQFYPQIDENTFVYGGEWRLQAAYKISKEMTIRVAWENIYFMRGLGRDGLDPTTNDEDALLTGLSFGFTVNR